MCQRETAFKDRQMASLVADVVSKVNEESDPWFDALEKAFLERESGALRDDPEDIRTVILRRLCIKYDVPGNYVDQFMPLLLQQFVYDYSRAQSVRKCFELVDVNFIDLIPKKDRQQIEKRQHGRGKDPFRLRGTDGKQQQ